MPQFANCPWTAVALLVCGTGCVQRFDEQVATEAEPIQTHLAASPSIQIAVDALDTCRIDTGEPMRLETLPTILQERTRQMKQAQVEPAEFSIRISVDDAAPYSSFKQVVAACRATGFSQFELVVAKLAFPFDLTPLAPSAAPDDLRLPPLELRLRAGNNGELAALTLNDRQLADLAQLQLEIIAVIGDDRGPGSIHEMIEVEFDCDDNLRFKHLADAYLAIASYEASDGSRVVLVEKIWPMIRWPLEEDEF